MRARRGGEAWHAPHAPTGAPSHPPRPPPPPCQVRPRAQGSGAAERGCVRPHRAAPRGCQGVSKGTTHKAAQAGGGGWGGGGGGGGGGARRFALPPTVPHPSTRLPARPPTTPCSARLVANPGCYPTSVQLPLVPLLEKGLISHEDIVIDAKSGAPIPPPPHHHHSRGLLLLPLAPVAAAGAGAAPAAAAAAARAGVPTLLPPLLLLLLPPSALSFQFHARPRFAHPHTHTYTHPPSHSRKHTPPCPAFPPRGVWRWALRQAEPAVHRGDRGDQRIWRLPPPPHAGD